MVELTLRLKVTLGGGDFEGYWLLKRTLGNERRPSTSPQCRQVFGAWGFPSAGSVDGICNNYSGCKKLITCFLINF